MKSSWITVCALAVAVLGLISAIMLFMSSAGSALLAITLSGAAAALLLAAQQILTELAQIHKGMVTFNTDESRDFVDAVESSYSLKGARAGEPLATAMMNKPQLASEPAASGLLNEATGKTAAMPPPPPTPAKDDRYKPLAGLSLSAPSPAPANRLDGRFDDPNRTTPPTPALRMPEPRMPEPAAAASSASDELENTQSFLPSELQGSKRAETPHLASASMSASSNANNNGYAEEEELSPEATIGFSSPVLKSAAPPKEDDGVTYTEPMPALREQKSEPKGKMKLRKRYSTFAGLSLNDTGSMSRDTGRQDALEAAPAPVPLPKPAAAALPPPPPISRTKERKRYSTFAGLALNDRSAPPLPPPPMPAPPAPAAASAPMASSSKHHSSPFTATHLNFSKTTDNLGMDVAAEEARMNEATIPSMPPPRPAPPQPLPPPPPSPPPPPTKSSRKRYQTFMGLSLSKTPQPIKRLESPPPADATAPLPPVMNPAPVASAPQPSPSVNPAVNIGQLGNLVDGFCSLCGSPQAAGNEYSGVQSEPEFCWYCGAKLKTQ